MERYCVLDEADRSDFMRLQERAPRKGWCEGCDPVVYCAFDLLVKDGRSLIEEPVEKGAGDSVAGGQVRVAVHGAGHNNAQKSYEVNGIFWSIPPSFRRSPFWAAGVGLLVFSLFSWNAQTLDKIFRSKFPLL